MTRLDKDWAFEIVQAPGGPYNIIHKSHVMPLHARIARGWLVQLAYLNEKSITCQHCKERSSKKVRLMFKFITGL